MAPKEASVLKGKSLALDAVATGFAFVLYEMLARAGLSHGDYTCAAVGATPQRWEAVRTDAHVGTITIEPFTSIAKAQGFKVLDVSSNVCPVYQGGSFAASRAWPGSSRPSRLGTQRPPKRIRGTKGRSRRSSTGYAGDKDSISMLVENS